MPASRQVADEVIDRFERAAQAHLQTPGRRGNIIEINASMADDVLIAGDLHGHRLRYHKLLQIASLSDHPRRHLILQEVCHGGPAYPGGGCMSHLLLEDVAQLKCDYPHTFHFLMSNHELAELTDYPIIKGRRLLNLAFRCGLERMYGEASEQVRRAGQAFIGSCPLAVRLAGGVFVSHSLPEQTDLAGFDVSVFDRPLTKHDLSEHGSVFRLVWGRDFRAANANAFAKLVNANVLIQGHEPCQAGCNAPNDQQIILDCCNARACYIHLPTADCWTHAQALKRVGTL